ncbi:DUF1338 domain-containing protein [Thalassotalea mangrovi]|uniref:2-oxoadipate dioxygenase/decarboxylase n=1 Tax=Thalassotalea mangrovi TaxID=2572245 RepID=A0A4U1B3W9_9GAMM|nr:DUF1338 domain-containing protein [Thalassotalea mangrovi]TKB43957.1 DUF1338 domain-containing protein [Thalassotalea mangrovi]
MTLAVTELFENIWKNYLSVTPSAIRVHELLGAGEELINDHVAYRTFNLEKVGIDKLAAPLLALGYQAKGEYHFEAKKLYARHYEHADPTLPKVFISELLVEKMSSDVQAIIHKIVEQMDAQATQAENFLYSGTHWQISYDEYLTLLKESEYAAWLAAWGYRANHFTVSINHLEGIDCINQVNDIVRDGGFRLNSSGGEVKGSPDVKLEQSSTMADVHPVVFSDRTAEIPSCFYEFAKRYPMDCGNIYTGFVAASADKIFESTNQD